MSLRLKIAIGFAAVALATAAITSIAIPSIIGRGFAALQSDAASQAPDGRGGQGRGNGPGPQAAAHAAQIQQDTTVSLVIIAIGAALGASVVGFVAATRLARPLSQLAQASRRVASGRLAERSGLGERADEFGEVGRAFDEMASELARSDEERRRFIQDAAHELRTPLTVIDGTAGALEEGIFAPDPRHLRTIREQTQLLSRIVDDLRTISLAEAGQLELERTAVDVSQVLAAAASAFEARAKAASIRLETTCEAGLAAIVDERRLRQAILALADNALRHTPSGGTVRLVGMAVGATARIAVEDTGDGIPTEDLPHIFDRLYRADPSRDRRTGTSGLGLSIVRALVGAQGGRVGARNNADGGASVWIELPAVDQQGAEHTG